MKPEELHNIYRAEEEFWWYQGMREITQALLDSILSQEVVRGLDAGCGTGFNALALESRFGVQMFGVDVASLAIQYCRKRKFSRSMVASVLGLPFPDNGFDLVTSMDVLPFLPPGGDAQALREFVRVLRPGGWLLLRVAAFGVLRSRHSEWIAEHHRYRAHELLEKLRGLRCPVRRWTYVNSFLVPAALLKFRVWEALRSEPPHSGVEKRPPAWINRALRTVLQWEATLIRRGVRFPFGQSLIVLAQKPVTKSEMET